MSSFFSFSSIEESAELTQENPFEICGFEISLKVRFIITGVMYGVGFGLMLLGAIIGFFESLVTLFIYLIGSIIIIASVISIYGPVSLFHKFLHPLRTIPLILQIVCTLAVIICSCLIEVGGLAIFTSIVQAICQAFIIFTFLPIAESLLGGCCGGFFSLQQSQV